MADAAGVVRVNAKDFQEPLEKLANTLVQTLTREGQKHISGPATVPDDIAIMVRYSVSIYRLLFYLNADVRRQKDTDWNERYGVTAMQLVRSLIDCLYNITRILENPAEYGPAYRKSGLRKILEELNELAETYTGDVQWEAYVAERRKHVELLVRMSGYTVDEVMAQSYWQTLGSYLSTRKTGGVLDAHQQFFKRFTFFDWRQYSALSHGAYEAFAGTMGHLPLGAYYVTDLLPHDARSKIVDSYDMFLSTHVGRAALALLCIVTEIQAHAGFEGHKIDERIVDVWKALLPLFDARELYEGRYAKLMAESGIERS
jgi:hypothetical protein